MNIVIKTLNEYLFILKSKYEYYNIIYIFIIKYVQPGISGI